MPLTEEEGTRRSSFGEGCLSGCWPKWDEGADCVVENHRPREPGRLSKGARENDHSPREVWMRKRIGASQLSCGHLYSELKHLIPVALLHSESKI